MKIGQPSDEATDWRAVVILILAGFVAALHVGKAAIALPLLRQDLGIDLLTATVIVSAFATLGAIGGLSAGVAVSRLPARNTVIVGLVVLGVASVLGATAPHWSILFVIRVVEGSAFLVTVIAIPSLIRMLAAPADRTLALACWGVYVPAGSAIVMLAAPSLRAYGWQGLWLASGVASILYAFVVWRFVPPDRKAPRENRPRILADIKTVVSAPGPVLAALAFGTYTFHYFALTSLMPTLLIDRLGLDVAQAGSISAAIVIANAVGNLSAGAALRLGLSLWAIVAASFAVCGLVAPGIFADWLPVAAVAILASASLAITGLIPASIFAATPSLAPRAELTGITLGLIIQASNLGQLLGPMALAFWAERFGWSTAPVLIIAIALTGIAIALGLRTQLRSRAGQS
jgi:predicted MFS family arabinose efflux permease